MSLAVLLLLGLCACVVVADPLTEDIYALQDPYDRDVKFLIVVTTRNDTDDGSIEYECEVIVNSNDLAESQLLARQVGSVSFILRESLRSNNFGSIDDFLEYFTGYIEVKPSGRELRSLMADCNAFPTRTKRRRTGVQAPNFENAPISELLAWTEPIPGFNMKFQGTKWCGVQVAKNFEDLGVNADADKCCRVHNYCDDKMAPGEVKYNITNRSLFTAYSCRCDHELYYCLDAVDDLPANTLGNTYFSVLKRPCYYEDYPYTRECKKYKTFLKLSCQEYVRDNTAEKLYQWRFAPDYEKIPDALQETIHF